MDKRIKFLFTAGIILLIAVILGINILIRKYEKEPLPSPAKGGEGLVDEEIKPAEKQEETQDSPLEIEREPAINERILLN